MRTTHYAGSFNWAESVARLPAEDQKIFHEDTAEPDRSRMLFDVWVDDQHLPRKLRLSPPQGETGDTTVLVFRDYGKPVRIVAPPPQQVTEFSSFGN